MAETITPEKLRELAADCDRGAELGWIDHQAPSALRVAADEIERLERLLDQERPVVVLTETQRQIAMRLLRSPGALVTVVEDEDAPKFVPLSAAEPRHRPTWAGGDEYRAEQERLNRRSAAALTSLAKPTNEG